MNDKTPVVDLLAEADKGNNSRVIVWCDSSTLNTPTKAGLTTYGRGLAIIGSATTSYATILYIPFGGRYIYMNAKSGGEWRGWASIADIS